MRLIKYREKYAVEWWDGSERYRRSLGTDDPLKAQIAFDQYKRVHHELTRKPVTVADVWDGYRKSLGDRPAATTMGFEWKSVGPHFGEKVASIITEEDCASYVAKRRAQGRSDGTIWTELGRLRMAVLWAEKKGLIEKAPAIDRPSPPGPRQLFMTQEEVSAFYKAATMPHVNLWAKLAIATAGRASAILQLKWDRIDFGRGLIHLHDPERSVTRKGRATVPMTPTIRRALDQAKREATCDYVVEWGGDQVRSVKKSVAAAAKRAGLPWVTPHVFRKTAARLMAEKGVSMDEIAQYLGHDDARTTSKIYARFSPSYLSGAASALDFE